MTFLPLGITPDFVGVNFGPHRRLFFILNAVGICENPHAAQDLVKLAGGQLPGPMIDAHLMRAWIRQILATGDALKSGEEGLLEQRLALTDALVRIANQIPPAVMDSVSVDIPRKEWRSG